MTELQDEYLMQLKFYSTDQYSFKVYLAASNDSIELAENEYHYISEYRPSSYISDSYDDYAFNRHHHRHRYI